MLTDNNLNAASATQNITLSGTGTAGSTTATVTLGNLNQTYTGSPLSATASTSPAALAVALTYNGSAAPPTAAGTYTVVATVTNSGYTGSTTGTLTIAKATPVVTWATPAGIPSGTALSATQLNATASVPGTFIYSPASGAVPPAGTDTLSVTFTPTDTVDYMTAAATVSLAVGQATPTITWATPTAITYGTALSTTQLNATSSVAGAFAYSPAAGTVLTAGAYTLTATFSPTDTANYSGATKSVGITVNPALLSLSANNATRIYGTANPTFAGTVSAGQNGDVFTETFATSATTLSNVGTYSIVPSVTGTNLSSYSQNPVNGILTITQAGSTTSFSVSSSSIASGQSVTLTAQVVSATTGTPTGSVQFYDGTTLLNTATLTGGTASYATASLTPGASHVLTAVYPGDANFTGSNGPSSQTVVVSGTLDFSITPITSSNNVVPGNAATYSLQITPASGSYPSSVNFTAAGLPPGATATFSPASIPANGGAQTVTVSIQTASATAWLQLRNKGRTFSPIAFGLLLLPFAGVRRLRRSSWQWKRFAYLALLLTAGTIFSAALTGCGSGNGFFGEAPKTYAVALTATSGTVQHSTTVTLNVQ